MKSKLSLLRLPHTVRIGAAFLAFSSLVALGFPALGVYAATAAPQGPGNGLRVSPVRQDFTVQPGTTKVVNVTVTNVTGGAATFQAIINDFVANSDESGNPALLLDPNQFAPSHSLKRFISNVPPVSLQPGEEKSVSITIKVPANAAGGGYYGAVRFAPGTNPNTKNAQLSLSGNVGSLILVKVPGDIKEQLSIASIDVLSDKKAGNFFTTNKNLSVTVRFQNQGNIQEAPFGKLLVKNHSNKTIGSYEINNVDPAGNVLPDSIRKFNIPIKAGSFGSYKVEGNFGYGSSGQLLSAATSFYVIPFYLILIFITIVALLVVAIFAIPRLIKAYNRRVLKRAGRR